MLLQVSNKDNENFLIKHVRPFSSFNTWLYRPEKGNINFTTDTDTLKRYICV